MTAYSSAMIIKQLTYKEKPCSDGDIKAMRKEVAIMDSQVLRISKSFF
jgi:hypothetical protein